MIVLFKTIIAILPTLAKPDNTIKAVIVMKIPTWSQFQLAMWMPSVSPWELACSPYTNVGNWPITNTRNNMKFIELKIFTELCFRFTWLQQWHFVLIRSVKYLHILVLFRIMSGVFFYNDYCIQIILLTNL